MRRFKYAGHGISPFAIQLESHALEELLQEAESGLGRPSKLLAKPFSVAVLRTGRSTISKLGCCRL